MADIQTGVVGEASVVVTDALTAASAGSGFVPAYATPAMIALMEAASAEAIRKYLESGQTSVGTAVNVSHLAATPVGMRVRVRAEVTAVEGRRVSLRVEAWDEREKIGEGTHTRAIVDQARFMERLAIKARGER